MKMAAQSQDPLFIEKNALLSYLFLTTAVYPHLSKIESVILESIWHRTARFGIIGHTLLSYSTVVNGSGECHKSCVPNGDIIWGKKRFPVYPEISERHFRRSRMKLLSLGLISRLGYTEDEEFFYRISCYPRDFIDSERTLIEALSLDSSAVGYSILRDIVSVTKTLKRTKKL